MAISERSKKRLWGNAANQCSMPGCSRILASGQYVAGEMAHIIAQSQEGPRASAELTEADEYSNLILLCEEHHKLVDAQPEEWPSERLRLIKTLHEERVRSLMERCGTVEPIRSLLVFCGASSVGKDVVASRTQRLLLQRYGIETEFLDKYTSRQKRSDREAVPREERIPGSLYEPSSVYRFLAKGQISSHADCFFEYRKYGGSEYAFSREHLSSDHPDDKHLICILGALHRAEEFRVQVEREYKRGVFLVLLEAERDELFDRLDLRNTVGAEERNRRRSEIDKDLDRIERISVRQGGLLATFDKVIYNGSAPLPEAVAEVTTAMGSWVRWLEQAESSQTETK